MDKITIKSQTPATVDDRKILKVECTVGKRKYTVPVDAQLHNMAIFKEVYVEQCIREHDAAAQGKA